MKRLLYIAFISIGLSLHLNAALIEDNRLELQKLLEKGICPINQLFNNTQLKNIFFMNLFRTFNNDQIKEIKLKLIICGNKELLDHINSFFQTEFIKYRLKHEKQIIPYEPETYLIKAIWAYDKLEVVHWIMNGDDIDHKTYTGETALSIAEKLCLYDIYNLLLKTKSLKDIKRDIKIGSIYRCYNSNKKYKVLAICKGDEFYEPSVKVLSLAPYKERIFTSSQFTIDLCEVNGGLPEFIDYELFTGIAIDKDDIPFFMFTEVD